MTHPLWQPDQRFISAANLTHFMKEAGQRVGATFAQAMTTCTLSRLMIRPPSGS